MKKLTYTLILLFATSIIFIGCREKKSTAEKIGDGVEKVADDVKDAAEDAGDEIEDAVE